MYVVYFYTVKGDSGYIVVDDYPFHCLYTSECQWIVPGTVGIDD